MGLIFALILFDVIIKIIIYLNFMDVNVLFINDVLEFKPFINTKQMSVFNAELGMEISTFILIVINLIMLIVAMFFYYRIKKLNITTNKTVMDALIMFISAGTCSIIDKIVLGGSLDYIQIVNWICDLKESKGIPF